MLEYLIQNRCFVRIKVSKIPYIPKIWNSSPASRTKETVERLSLFCQSILAKTVKSPEIPIKTES